MKRGAAHAFLIVVALIALGPACAYLNRIDCLKNGTCGTPDFPIPDPTGTPTPVPDPTGTPAPDPTSEPTPSPTASPVPVATGTPSAQCPPLTVVQPDLYRIVDAVTRQDTGRTGSPENPARVGDVVIINVTPKTRAPFCPDARAKCELPPECQASLVGPNGPVAYQTLVGQFQNDPVVHSSSNRYILLLKIAPGETGEYTVTTCPESADPWSAVCGAVVFTAAE